MKRDRVIKWRWKLVLMASAFCIVFLLYSLPPYFYKTNTDIVDKFTATTTFELEYIRSKLLQSYHEEESRIVKFQIGNISPVNVSLVALYFKLKKSKHGSNAYQNWNKNFFLSATAAPLIIYTDNDSLKELVDMASLTNNSKTFYVFNNIWNLTRLLELERSIDLLNNSIEISGDRNLTKLVREYVNNYQYEQVKMDPEKHIHSPELYAVWNAKHYIMRRSSSDKHNIYKSKFFLYTDVGAFRSNVYPNWPDLDHLLKQEAKLKDRMLFSQVDEYSGNVRGTYIEGGFFAGSSEALRFYFEKFYDIHDEQLDQGAFVGKDQTTMNIYTQIKHPERSCKMYLSKMLGQCIYGYDIWFAYQFYFASHYSDRSPSFILNSTEIEKLASFQATESTSCTKSSKQFLANTYTIYCNNDTEFIAIPKCFKCN